jgi:hypothetical protein
LYGQYKRINQNCGQIGKGFLWGGMPVHIKAQGYGVVYFAKKMLADKGATLEGKKCLITGSHYVAMAVAEKLLELGAIPLTFSDSSGFVYEPNGFDAAKVKTVRICLPLCVYLYIRAPVCIYICVHTQYQTSPYTLSLVFVCRMVIKNKSLILLLHSDIC